MTTSTLNLRQNDFEDKGNDDAGEDVGIIIDLFQGKKKLFCN